MAAWTMRAPGVDQGQCLADPWTHLEHVPPECHSQAVPSCLHPVRGRPSKMNLGNTAILLHLGTTVQMAVLSGVCGVH